MPTTRPGKSIRRVTKPSSRELEGVTLLKCASSPTSDCRSEVLENYRANFSKPYNALALDYDGTLVSLFNRTGKLSRAIVSSIGNFLNNEIPIVIISGRGESLLRLRRQLCKFELGTLFLAMHNGAEIVDAKSGGLIRREKQIGFSLNRAFERLSQNPHIMQGTVKITQKPYFIQMQVKERSMLQLDELCRWASTVLSPGLVVRSSGYAVDIYPRSRMKDYCLPLLNEHLEMRVNFIRIGDQGHELGNDFELLNRRGGFSVGTVSADRRSCFPVVDEAGNRLLGVKGSIHLLNRTFQPL